MTISEYYAVAKRADYFGGVVFAFVFLTSIVLAVIPDPKVHDIGEPFLMGLTIAAIICTVITSIFQTEGNRTLRLTQLSDALGSGCGEPAPAGYYNNKMPQTLRRLAGTTMENTFFTKEILSQMAVGHRIKNGVFFVMLIIMLAAHWPPTSCLLVLAQALFSADLALKWVRLERFRVRTSRAFGQFEQFFLQGGDPDKPNDLAILIASFADYECAKDEAVFPLDDEIFQKLNPTLSAQWEQIKVRLKI